MATHQKRGRPQKKKEKEEVDFELKLIEEFRRRPVLYDFGHGYYSNNYEVLRLWREIAEELGQDVTRVRWSWSQIRNRYYVEKGRIERLRNEYKNPISTWNLYSKLNFLDYHIRWRHFRVKVDPQSKQSLPISSCSEIDDDDDMNRGSLEHVASASTTKEVTAARVGCARTEEF